MATIQTMWNNLRSKHWKIASSSGSLGIIGIVCLIVAAVLLFWKPFLGGVSAYVAFALMVLVPLLNL